MCGKQPRYRTDRQLYFVGEQRGVGRRFALVGHMHAIRCRCDPEGSVGEVNRRACTAGAVVQFGGLRLGQHDQLHYRVGRHFLVDDEDEVGRGELADRREIGEWLEGQFAVDAARDRQARRGNEQRVAVGHSLGHNVGAYVAARAAPVVHQTDVSNISEPLTTERAKVHDAAGNARRAGSTSRETCARRPGGECEQNRSGRENMRDVGSNHV